MEMSNNMYSSLCLVAYNNPRLPEKTICVSSKIYSKYKDTTNSFVIRNPVISVQSLVKIEDLNITESDTLDDDICFVSDDIAIMLGIDSDFRGDVMNIISI